VAIVCCGRCSGTHHHTGAHVGSKSDPSPSASEFVKLSVIWPRQVLPPSPTKGVLAEGALIPCSSPRPAGLDLKQPTSDGHHCFSDLLLHPALRQNPVVILLILVVGLECSSGLWNFLKDYRRNDHYLFNPDWIRWGEGTISFIEDCRRVRGILGKGFMNGTQCKLGFLPSSRQTSSFAVDEEWGSWLSLCVSSICLILWDSGLPLNQKTGSARSSPSRVSMLFWHVFINIGMVLASCGWWEFLFPFSVTAGLFSSRR